MRLSTELSHLSTHLRRVRSRGAGLEARRCQDSGVSTRLESQPTMSGTGQDPSTKQCARESQSNWQLSSCCLQSCAGTWDFNVSDWCLSPPHVFHHRGLARVSFLFAFLASTHVWTTVFRSMPARAFGALISNHYLALPCLIFRLNSPFYT